MSEMTAGYRDLKAWQQSMSLVPEIYGLMKKLPREERYALGEQMHRRVISIPASIAEGQGRGNPSEFVRFLSKALGNLSVLDTLLLVAQRLRCLKTEDVKRLMPQMNETHNLIRELLHKVKSTSR